MPDPLSSAKPIMNRPGCCDDDEHSHHFDRRSPPPQQHSTGSSDSDSEMGKKRGPYICKEVRLRDLIESRIIHCHVDPTMNVYTVLCA